MILLFTTQSVTDTEVVAVNSLAGVNYDGQGRIQNILNNKIGVRALLQKHPQLNQFTLLK